MQTSIVILGSMKPAKVAAKRHKFITISPAVADKLQMAALAVGCLVTFAGVCLGIDTVTAIGAAVATTAILRDMKGGD